MHTEPVYELTVYEADDVTPLFVVSTDPAHANPYLKAPTSFPEQEIDFAKGSASIGQCRVQIVDVPTDPTDQATGFFTGQLADEDGNTQINGHRAVLTEDRGSGAELVLDGVVRNNRLLDTYVTFELELRDIRERERKTKAFATTDTPTILPRGVLDGYGIHVTLLATTTRYPLPPTSPLTGTYRLGGLGFGEIEIAGAGSLVLTLTPPMREALESAVPLEATPSTVIHDRWKLLWRDKTLGGAYTVVTQIAHRHPDLPGGGGQPPFTLAAGSTVGDLIRSLRVNNVVSLDTLPSNGQEIEFIVQYDGPVTEDWPHHIEGLTVGELLRNLYRGDYSDEDPRIRYDEAALLDLTTRIRAKIGKPIDDLRAWAEKHAYPIVHSAPTLNVAGEISPITYLLPDENETLPNLDNTNCRPAGGGWSHGAEDAINIVRAPYKRDYRVSESQRAGLALSDQIRTVEQPVTVRNQASIDLIGEQPLEVSSDLLRSIGSSDGGPLFGDVTDETGTQVAYRIGRMAIDRFSRGGQYFALEGSRDDADVEALKVGSWTVVGVSWMPDYLSGERGLSRLAQVVARRNLSSAWCALTLIDAGSAHAPLGQPTLGTVTADDAGVVSIPITALAAGDPDARVDYAVDDTEPAANSSLWTFLDRADAIETLTTPPLPAGETGWVRARSEAVGRRPSAYTTPVSVAIPSTPRVLEVSIELDELGVPTVRWTPNQFCLGVRVYYQVHALETVPTFPDQVDADAADGELELSELLVDRATVVTVQVEPYTGWTGAAVSGTAGPVVERRASSLYDRDLSVTVSAVKAVPISDPTTPGAFYLELLYNVGVDVEEIVVDLEADFVGFGGFEEFSYTIDDDGSHGTINPAGGRHRLRASGGIDMEWLLTDEAVKATLTGQIAGGVAQGTPHVVDIGDMDELGSGVKADLSAGGSASGDRLVGGSGILIDRSAAGHIELSVDGGGGGADELADLSDVGVTTPTNRNVLVADGDSWESRELTAEDVAAGTFKPGAAGEDVGLRVTATGAAGPTGGHAFLHLEGDATNLSGEPGGAYLLLSQDNQLVSALIGTNQASGSLPDRSVAGISGLGVNDLVIRAFDSGATPAIAFVLNDDLMASILSTGIESPGNVRSSASDRRLKTAIEPIAGALARVCRWAGITYRWNDVAEELGPAFRDQARHVGLIAQEVQSDRPEAVAPSPADPRYLTIMYERLVPDLVEAIKELAVECAGARNERDELRRSVDELRTVVDALRKEI